MKMNNDEKILSMLETVVHRLDNIETDVSALKKGQIRLETDVSALKKGQKRLEKSIKENNKLINEAFVDIQALDHRTKSMRQIRNQP